jgi:hypothetical protein
MVKRMAVAWVAAMGCAVAVCGQEGTKAITAEEAMKKVGQEVTVMMEVKSWGYHCHRSVIGGLTGNLTFGLLGIDDIQAGLTAFLGTVFRLYPL